MYASNDWAHDVVTTSNQRQWRWFNVFILRGQVSVSARNFAVTSLHSTESCVRLHGQQIETRISCTKNDIEVNAWRRKHMEAELDQENLMRMVRWIRWHCPPDTGYEIGALAVWGWRRYVSVTLLNLYERAEKKHFVSLKLECKSGVRARDLRFPSRQLQHV